MGVWDVGLVGRAGVCGEGAGGGYWQYVDLLGSSCLLSKENDEEGAPILNTVFCLCVVPGVWTNVFPGVCGEGAWVYYSASR